MMTRSKHPFISHLIWLGIALYGCAETSPEKRASVRKPPTSSSSQTPSGGDAVPVISRKVFIALLGGRGSCDRFPTLAELKSRNLPPDYSEFGKLLQNLEGALPEKPTFFVSCLPNGTPLKDDFKYFTNADEIRTGNQSPNQAKLAGIEPVLTSLARAANETYLIGHSYGGWTVMKLAPAVGREQKIKALITLDPISAVNCTPMSGFFQFLSKTGSGCNEAPTDFGVSGLQSIRGSAERWINFYQDANKSLHASEISEAGENHKLEYENVAVLPGILDYKNPHYFVGTGADTWGQIRDLILTRNSSNQVKP